MNIFNILNSINENSKNIINSFYKELTNNTESTPNPNQIILDRYEKTYAICEDLSTGKILEIPKSKIDSNAKDGDILKLENHAYVLDYEKTKIRKEKIETFFEELKKQ